MALTQTQEQEIQDHDSDLLGVSDSFQFDHAVPREIFSSGTNQDDDSDFDGMELDENV